MTAEHPVSQVNRRKNKSRTIILIGIFMAVIILSGVSIFLIFNTINNAQVPEQVDFDIDFEQDTNLSQTESDAIEKEKNIKQYEGSNPGTSDVVTGIINYAVIDEEGHLDVRTSIDQYGNGTCKFTFYSTTNDETIERESTIVLGPTTASCRFNGAMPNSNKWVIVVEVTMGAKTGIIKGETE